MLLTLTDQVAAAFGSHARRVDSTCRDITAFAFAIGLGLTTHRQCHLTAQDDVRSLFVMSVIWVVRVWAVLPDEGVGEAFALELRGEGFFVHRMILAAKSE